MLDKYNWCLLGQFVRYEEMLHNIVGQGAGQLLNSPENAFHIVKLSSARREIGE